MGYESTIVIGEGTELKREAGTFFQETARFDLGKLQTNPALIFEPSDYYIYNTGSDEQFNRDCYGERLGSASIKDTVKWLKSSKNEYLATIAKTLVAISKHLKNPQILHFGR